MVRALKFIGRDHTRLAFFLCLSILGHLAVLIYMLPATFPNLKDEPASEAKLKALTVQIMPAYNDYHEPIIVASSRR